jgi:putative methionine-R-sulfoxide reductase with GAF domain
MFELGIRLIAALVCAAGAWTLKLPAWESIAKVSAMIAAYSVLGFLLERRGLRNAMAAGFMACLDALCVALLLAAAGQLDRFGFLVLAPIAYAASRFGSLPTSMAPIAAGGVIAAHTLYSRAAAPGIMLSLQAAAILAVGLLLNHRRIVVKVAQPVLPTAPEPLADAHEARESLELRESFRKLKEIYQDLERKSRRDRLSVSLFEARTKQGEPFFKALAMKLRDITQAESLALYTLAQFDERMIVRGTSGDYPSTIRDASVDVDLRHSAKQIATDSLTALNAISAGKSPQRLANVVLRHEGKVIGMICLSATHPDHLADALEIAEEMADSTAAMIVEETRRQSHSRRMAEAELLYELATSMHGAKNASSLAARAARDAWELLEVDHLGIFFLDGSEAFMAAHQGANIRFLDVMSFAGGPGIEGWQDLGSPELVVFDVFEDPRVPQQMALKKRVGSFALFPIQFGDKPYGYVTAATHRTGGVDVETVELLRSVAGELSHAIARLEGLDLDAAGIASPGEFHAAVQATPTGHLVFLDPSRKDRLIEQFGKPAFENALRQFARKLRAKLPANSLVCRRPDGDYMVLLRGVSAEFAVSWANEMCALASFIGLRLPESDQRIPLALRAKVADLSQQTRQLSEQQSA